MARVNHSFDCSMENNEEEENQDCIDLCITRPSLGSEIDFDDELALPNSLTIIDVDGKPVAIEQSEEEINNGKYDYTHTQCIFSMVCIRISKTNRDG